MKFKITEAYMNQERKQVMVPKIKELCQQYKVKGTLSVEHHSTVRLTIREGKVDFMGNYVKEGDVLNPRNLEAMEDEKQRGYIQVNPYWYKEHFTGEALEFLGKALEIMNEGNHDRSDIQSDYFDVGWYVDVNIGEWNKPYVYTGEK